MILLAVGRFCRNCKTGNRYIHMLDTEKVFGLTLGIGFTI